MAKEPILWIERFSVFQRFIHLLIILSFITLAITGLQLIIGGLLLTFRNKISMLLCNSKF